MKLPISLGENLPLGGPISVSSDEPMYPSVYLRGTKDLNLPESGEITFKFKVRRETETKTPGKSEYECCLDLTDITDVEPGEENTPDSETESTSDALDRHRRELEAEKDGENY